MARHDVTTAISFLGLVSLAASANAQQVIDQSEIKIWVVKRGDVLAQLRRQLPDPDRARVRGLAQITSHTACGEVSYAPGAEPFRRFCFGLVNGATF